MADIAAADRPEASGDHHVFSRAEWAALRASTPLPLTEAPLTFEPVDHEAFPAVDRAYRVGGLGLTFPAVMNAANEVAVMAFLEGKIPLPRIVEIVQTIVDEHEPASIVSVVNIERADSWARRRTAEIIEAR